MLAEWWHSEGAANFAPDVNEIVTDMRHDVVAAYVTQHIPPNAYAEQWDVDGLKTAIDQLFQVDLPIPEWAAEEGIADEEIRERIVEAVDAKAEQKVVEVGEAMLSNYESAKELVTFVRSNDQLFGTLII